MNDVPTRENGEVIVGADVDGPDGAKGQRQETFLKVPRRKPDRDRGAGRPFDFLELVDCEQALRPQNPFDLSSMRSKLLLPAAVGFPLIIDSFQKPEPFHRDGDGPEVFLHPALQEVGAGVA